MPLAAAVIVVWVIAGLADWYCHRRMHIEATSGLRESLMHAALITQVSIPILVVALFQLSLFTLAIVFIGFALHLATSLADLAYASPRRHVSYAEHMIHYALNAVPFVAIILIVVTDSIAYDFSLRFRALSDQQIIYYAVLGSIISVFIVVPYGEEAVRCFCHTRSGKHF